MKSLIAFSILFLVSLSSAYSQDTITTKVIVFDEDDMSKYDDESSNYGKNAIKINPLLVLNGEIPIYFERVLFSSFTAEFAIGITYVDYIGNLLDDSDKNYESSDRDQVHSNPSFKLGLRYYSGGIALDGFYFALEYAKRKYSITKEVIIFDYNNNKETTSYFKEENSINEFKLIVGSQTHNYWDNFFFDYYGGVGIRNESYTEIVEDFSNPNFTTYKLEAFKKSGPAFYLGLKIGFEF